MVSPEWFFSTVAQAVAASIGFVIAFTAAVFTMRRDRYHRLVAAFTNDIMGVQEEFDALLARMAKSIVEDKDYSRDNIPSAYSRLDKETRSWLSNQDDFAAAYVLHRLLRAVRLLGAISQSTDGEEANAKFEELESVLEDLQLSIDWEAAEDGFPKQLYKEIKESDPTDNYHEENLFSGHPRLSAFFEQKETQLSKGASNQLNGWRFIIQTIKVEVDRVRSRHNLSEVARDETDSSRKVLLHSGILFFIGVILPVLFLITPPYDSWPSFPEGSQRLFLVEIIVIVAIIIETGVLFRNLRKMIAR